MRSIKVVDTGRVSYKTSYKLQQKYHNELMENSDFLGKLIITEPDPTITKGIRGEESEIFLSEKQRKKIEVVDIKRGGRVTFHGPGQLVIYPILNLNHFKKSIRWYVESLEKAVISTLEELGIESHKKDGIVGIFTEKGKICAIGIEVKRWRTLHGIAINHEIDLDYFKTINPCGLASLGVSSIKNEKKNVSREHVVEVFKEKFTEIFDIKLD